MRLALHSALTRDGRGILLCAGRPLYVDIETYF